VLALPASVEDTVHEGRVVVPLPFLISSYAAPPPPGRSGLNSEVERDRERRRFLSFFLPSPVVMIAFFDVRPAHPRIPFMEGFGRAFAISSFSFPERDFYEIFTLRALRFLGNNLRRALLIF